MGSPASESGFGVFQTPTLPHVLKAHILFVSYRIVFLVDRKGFEPLTFRLQSGCSPTELVAHAFTPSAERLLPRFQPAVSPFPIFVGCRRNFCHLPGGWFFGSDLFGGP